MTVPKFEDYVASLSPVDTAAATVEPQALGLCQEATAAIAAALPLDRQKLAAVVAESPHLLPVYAAAAGLSQERFRTWLQARFGTAGWVTLGRSRAAEVIDRLDDDHGIVAALQSQSSREWTWADVLARTMVPRQRAGGAIEQGRALENAVEAVIDAAGLASHPRTRFEGTAGQTAPADFAIPGALAEARIAVGVKGYDSTGSKLTDAATEIETMATVRKPTQFIFAIVDGHGWLRRKQDLRRIYALWEHDRIDGVYNQATLDAFSDALTAAARRIDLL